MSPAPRYRCWAGSVEPVGEQTRLASLQYRRVSIVLVAKSRIQRRLGRYTDTVVPLQHLLKHMRLTAVTVRTVRKSSLESTTHDRSSRYAAALLHKRRQM